MAIDSITYAYNKGQNQLNYIKDAVASTNYTIDIDNESQNNYKYNGIGQHAKIVPME